MGSNKKLHGSVWYRYVNKYSITLVCFLVWILFIDRHNLITQYRLKSVIREMEMEKENFHKLYQAALKEQELLEKDREKYAREKYLMHKDNEEIFIFK